MPHRHRLTACLVALAVVGAEAGPARAQGEFGAELVVLGLNALLGGTTAGLGRELNGGEFTEGFRAGAAGGAAVYAGKRLNTVRVAGVGLAGRVVAAAGMSVVRNSAANRPEFERIIVPVGPLMVHWRPESDSGGVRVKVHLARTAYLGYLVLHEDFALDWGATLSAGAPLFRGRDAAIRLVGGRRAGGIELLGAIALSDPAVVRFRDEWALVSHERVHVVQDDFFTIAWTDPLEDWLLERVPAGETIGRYVDTGLVYLATGWLAVTLVPYEDRPWEKEAAYFGR